MVWFYYYSREKELMLATLDYLSERRKAVIAGEVTFQLDIKVCI